MYDQLTDQSRLVIKYAQEEAHALNCPLVDTQHLLLALTHDDVGIAVAALNDVGLTRTRLLEAVQNWRFDEIEVPVDDPLFTLEALDVCELAVKEAFKLGHHNIDSAHLLLALIANEESVVVSIIQGLGVKVSDLRDRVYDSMMAQIMSSDRVVLNQLRAQLAFHITSRQVTKSDLVSAIGAVIDNLSRDDVIRMITILKK